MPWVKKISITPSVGTVFSFLTKQKIKTQLVQGAVKEEQTINKIEGTKSGYFAATAGMAFEYDVNKRIAINIMPKGNFALTSINKDAGVQFYPNAFRMSGGVKIKFWFMKKIKIAVNLVVLVVQFLISGRFLLSNAVL